MPNNPIVSQNFKTIISGWILCLNLYFLESCTRQQCLILFLNIKLSLHDRCQKRKPPLFRDLMRDALMWLTSASNRCGKILNISDIFLALLTYTGIYYVMYLRSTHIDFRMVMAHEYRKDVPGFHHKKLRGFQHIIITD